MSIFIAVFICVAADSNPTPPPYKSPKLIVVLVVDQMRADYLEKFSSEWRAGLKRLTRQGAWFTNAAYPYSGTVTCAGHATISTGTFPDVHGMIDNTWWDRKTEKSVTCTGDPATHLLAYDGGSVTASEGDSAWRMKVPAFAQELQSTYTGSRVVTFSLKERAAVTLAGLKAKSVTWLEGSRWVTSDAYGPQPSEVITQFVRTHPLSEDAGEIWTSAANSSSPAQDASHFSYPIGKTSGTVDPEFVSAWTASPYSDAYLERMAATAIQKMQLGRNSAPDFLAISFSALDLVGHHYGPDSPEVHDLLLKLDETLGNLLAALDAEVGAGNYVLAFSADHGVAPVPELALAEGKPAGRVDSSEVVSQIEKALAAHHYPEKSIALFDDGNLYFHPEAAEKLKNDLATSRSVLVAARSVDGVADAFWGDQLKVLETKNPLARAASLSYFPGRSGDLIVISKPYWFFDGSSKPGHHGYGTTHGTPYPYDQRVPVIFFGAGIKSGQYADAVTPADIAPTLAALASVSLPSTEGHPLNTSLSPSRAH